MGGSCAGRVETHTRPLFSSLGMISLVASPHIVLVMVLTTLNRVFSALIEDSKNYILTTRFDGCTKTVGPATEPRARLTIPLTHRGT